MSTKRFVLWSALALAMIALGMIGIVSCSGPALSGSKAGITIRINDQMMARTILPGHSLNAGSYQVHGAGTSGVANGATFDVLIPASTATTTVELTPGGWTITAAVNNDETPSMVVGHGSASFTVELSTPQTVTVGCIPDSGTGTFDIAASWVPDILSVPSTEAELIEFSGTEHPITMNLDSSTAAHGTIALPSGWYLGSLRIYDSAQLDAGIIETVRLAAGMTTTWAPFLTVSQLQGAITANFTYAWSPPLTLAATPAAGEYGLFDGEQLTLTITGADFSSGKSGVYAWYKNGVLTALSTTNSLTVNASDYDIGSHVYISGTCWQTDGARVGVANWQLDRQHMNLALNVTGNVSASGPVFLELNTPGGSTGQEVDQIITGPGPYVFSNVQPGIYKLLETIGGLTKYWNAAGTGDSTMGSADIITIPNPTGLAYICNY